MEPARRGSRLEVDPLEIDDSASNQEQIVVEPVVKDLQVGQNKSKENFTTKHVIVRPVVQSLNTPGDKNRSCLDNLHVEDVSKENTKAPLFSDGARLDGTSLEAVKTPKSTKGSDLGGPSVAMISKGGMINLASKDQLSITMTLSSPRPQSENDAFNVISGPDVNPPSCIMVQKIGGKR